MKQLTVLAVVAACGGGAPKQIAVTPPPAPPPIAAVPARAEPAPPPMAQGHPKDGLIPRAVLFGNPAKTALQISPDGAWYSWLAPKDGVLNVWVAPASDVTKARALTSETARPIRSYFWALDKKHLLYLQDKAGDENFHVFAIDVTAATPAAVDLYPVDKAHVEFTGASPRKPGLQHRLGGVRDRLPILVAGLRSTGASQPETKASRTATRTDRSCRGVRRPRAATNSSPACRRGCAARRSRRPA
jgi:hypothetical protein